MARKFKSYRKHNYKEGGGKAKKTILIVLAIVLALVVVTAALLLLLGNNSINQPIFSVQSPPDKITYYVGETPSWIGLEIMLVTTDGNIITLGPENCTITGFDSSAPADNQVITVKYKDYTTQFTIDILNETEQKPTDNLFVGMTFKTMPTTEYKVGDWLNVKNGVLLKQYSDGTTEEMALTYGMISGFTSAKPGKYTLTVEYVEDGHRATLTYEITVTN